MFVHLKMIYSFHRCLDFLQVVHFQLKLLYSVFTVRNKMSTDPLKILAMLRVTQKISH